jgi:CRISPR-associated DxTHG motif protein
MARTIITFLNNQSPRETRYLHRGTEYRGGYFPEALVQFCPFDRMLVFVTPEARAEAWPALQARCPNADVAAIDIPAGRTTEEIWEIFRAVVNAVQPNDEIVIDITHALRSIPFLAFLFVAYLQFSGAARLDALYYGALELADRKLDGPAPVIDLTEFAGMLQWIGAAEQFTSSGNGEAIARLLLVQSHKARPTNPAAADALQDASMHIENLTRALELNLPMETAQAARRLFEDLPDLLARSSAHSPQMRVLGNRVRTRYENLGLPSMDLTDRRVLISAVEQQRLMALAQLKRGAYYQAALLIHETLVSAVMVHLGDRHIDEYEPRQRVHRTLQIFRRIWEAQKNGEEYQPTSSARRDLADPKITRWLQILGALPYADRLARTIKRATRLRNHLAHCGFESTSEHGTPSSAHDQREALHEAVKALSPLLRQLLKPSENPSA